MYSSAGRVLLVEDNPDDLELALIAFERFRLLNKIDVARDGAEALRYLGLDDDGDTSRPPHELPHLILLDIKLPRVDGIDVLRRIKAAPITRHLPVVMLTSSAQERDLQDCYTLGVNSYIVKPVDVEQFFEAVQQVGNYWLVLNRNLLANVPPLRVGQDTDDGPRPTDRQPT
jgi:two-component system response regulator